jgi:hypothetical protein
MFFMIKLIKKMVEQVNSPKIGTIVRHTGWRFEDNKNYPCDVLIIDGQYMSDDRISNFWHWQRVLSDGTLAETECGYGSFVKSDNNYEIETRVKRVG